MTIPKQDFSNEIVLRREPGKFEGEHTTLVIDKSLNHYLERSKINMKSIHYMLLLLFTLLISCSSTETYNDPVPEYKTFTIESQKGRRTKNNKHLDST